MNLTTMNNHVPVIVILTPNTLMGVGMRSILCEMFPFAAFKVTSDFADISESAPEGLFHIFASASYIIEHRDFFEGRRRKTIILTEGTPRAAMLEGYPQINITSTQEQIVASLRNMHSSVHGGGHPHGAMSHPEKEVLSSREIDVLRLVVEGCINKEIADKLNIALSTVISHRKNITEKLGIRSVAGLTIYAVMKRYINI